MNIDDDITDDLEFIKARIDELDDEIEIPTSIYSKNLIHLLDDIEQTEQIEQIEQSSKNSTKRPTLNIWKKPLVYAAMFALIFGVYYVSDINKTEPEQANIPMVTSSDNQIAPRSTEPKIYAESYTEIRKAIGDAFEAEQIYYSQSVSSNAAAAMPMAPAPTAGGEIGGKGGGGTDGLGGTQEFSSNGNSATSKKDAYSTNAQVQGVDEADIVKTDGDNLYVHRRLENGEQEIAIVESTSLEKVSAIPLGMDGLPEIYLTNERLVVLNANDERAVPLKQGNEVVPISQVTDNIFAKFNKPSIFSKKPLEGDGMMPYYNRDLVSSAIIFDVSDSKNPKEIRRFEQDGEYVSSRLYDGVLYMVSTKHIYSDARYDNTLTYELLPITGDSLTGVSETLAANCIAILPEYSSTAYAVVSAIDIGNDAKAATTKAVLADAEEIYMSEKNVYLTSTEYGRDKNGNSTPKTDIVKIAVDGTSVEYSAKTQVNGSIDNQFSMDEYDDHFRIATTSYKNGETQNNIYVLDKFLQHIGAIEGLASGEKIYSVRYMGDKAYVVTFKQIDPLFAIDLSDPKNPKVLGQLKIPGFSEYLHPLNENTLIGFGVNTKVLADGAVKNDGLKLSLFDVTDPINPIESGVFYLGNAGTYSEVLDNHRAFMYNKSRGIIGFPITVNTEINDSSVKDEWSRQYKVSFNGYMLMGVDEKSGFKNLASINSAEGVDTYTVNRDGLGINRGVYIDDKIYTISNNRIMEYSMDSYKKLREVKL